MDYSLPIANRTRAKKEEMFREMHKANKKIKIQKQHGSSNAESMSIDAHSEKNSSRNGEESGNLGPDLSTVVLDDSDEDVVFIGVVEETKEEEYVSIADDGDVGLDGSQVGENIGFSFRGVKMEDGVEESEGRKVEGSSTCNAPAIGGSGLGTRIIEDERGGGDEVLTMSEDDEETKSSSTDQEEFSSYSSGEVEPIESEHDDEDGDYCPSSSDEESRSSSGEESSEEVEEVKEGDDKDEKEIPVRKKKKNSKMGDGVKRSSKKEIVEEWSGGKEDRDERAVLLEKRKKKNKKENEGKSSSEKEIDDGNGRRKFGTANHPICLDEVESDAIDGGGDIDDDDDEQDEDEDEEEHQSEEEEEDHSEEVEKENEDKLYRGKPIMSKRTRTFKEDEVVKILSDSIWYNTELNFEEENGPVNKQTTLLLKFTFGVEEQSPPRRTEEDKELDEIWADLAMYINDASDDAVVRNDADIAEIELGKTNDTAARCSKGCHDLVLDEEKGLVCKFCLHVELESKYCVEPFARNPYGRSSKRDSGMVDRSIFGQLHHQDSIYHSRIGCNAGTVWDIIPGIGEGMHDHQREGFEFLWKNIAGGIDLKKLDDPNSFNGGNGCIISHAPGTGKTRLAIAFIQSYMELYPACRPVIVAPCGMLNAWEDEFRKWNYVEVPFHNLNKFELSGKEDKDAIALMERCKSSTCSSDSMRLVKFYSWKKDRSILAISYQLFIEFAGEASRKRKGRFSAEGGEHVRKALLEFPGLLVLDEGHIPRNDTSLLWKTFEKVKTGKRIILSGTPFQNNFDELFNTLSLAYPKFLDSVSSSQHRALPKRRRKGSEAKQLWDSLTCKIDETGDDSRKAQKLAAVREVIGPFVHVHKGDILQRKLPGLRDSVVILHPPSLQKTVIDAVQQKKINNFKFEFLTAVVSVHPSLLPKSFPVEGTSIDCSMLECMRLNPDAGSKTKFVMELIRLSMVRNEKVLVFSQYIRSLKLVSDQLKSLFEWIPEKDFLYMDGKLELDRRKASIDNFNIDSEAKVMLASTKACCEGINLVGASRVVLLDVVWNPSVERQAISRAYRLGQKKIVHVYHLISSGSKEEKKYWRQAKKDKLSEIVFHSAADDQSGSRSNPDQFSSGIGGNDRIMEDMVTRLGNLFKKIIYQPKESNLVESFGLMDM